ncbi:MAG: hypothetical protein Q7T55_23195 [Solirubrobacteraceae bacterium]|nr:hypothetical protein [Solirubrobacteraceae bacterium]
MASARSARHLATALAVAASAFSVTAPPAWSHAGHAGHRMPPGMTMWAVGTDLDPLVMRVGDNPLVDETARNAPGTTSHGTLGAAVVDGLIAARRDAAEQGALARRSGLTTAQATKALSKRCQKLVKSKATRLTKADRKRRTACLAERKRRIEASKKAPATPTPTPAPGATPGISAPPAPVQGPAPTTEPPAATPTPTPMPGAPEPTPTPAPSGPVYGAVGVTATEGAEPFRLSRSSTTADIVNFELVNTDSQPHDLYIAPADENGEISGPPTKIIGRTPGQMQNKPTRASVDMKLAPGRYRLICTVPGHGKMEVGFTVYAPKT